MADLTLALVKLLNKVLIHISSIKVGRLKRLGKTSKQYEANTKFKYSRYYLVQSPSSNS